jgi:hypothetical protein
LISGAILALSDFHGKGFLDFGIKRRCGHDDNITSHRSACPKDLQND